MIISNLQNKNQFVINQDNGDVIFQSNNTVIAKLDNEDKKTILDEQALNYSRTTTKHLCIFLHETRKEIERKIKSGEYILANLN